MAIIETSYSVENLNARFSEATANELLEWASNEFGNDLALACSLGAEDVALVDLLSKIGSQAKVFVLDTGRLNEETYEALERCRSRYRMSFDIYTPLTQPLQALLKEKGPLSFYESVENRKECCFIRKVEPLQRALKDKSAWITGLRRQQAVTRATLPKIELDSDHGGILKLNPLADWTEEDVWRYIRENDVPYNALHDRGFPSIGCAPCTRAIKPGEDVRAGRWWWESPEHKECGLHVKRSQN